VEKLPWGSSKLKTRGQKKTKGRGKMDKKSDGEATIAQRVGKGEREGEDVTDPWHF